jgi:hypothetical protein
MKIVINESYGGFGLSDTAFKIYLNIKYVFSIVESVSETTYLINGNQISKYDILSNIDRNDPILIEIVERLGDEANGECSDLSIINIPDDVDWYIFEYDGYEYIVEKHRAWGKLAPFFKNRKCI